MDLKRKVSTLLLAILLTSVVQSQCPSADPLCLLCVKDECLVCSKSFKKDKGCQISSVAVSHCLTYASDGVCEICKFGYYKDSQGKCSKILIENCLTIDYSTMACTSCANGIVIKDGKCTGASKCSIENCQVCGINKDIEVCGLCKSGYVIKHVGKLIQCVPETPKTANCMLLDPNNGEECLLCLYNFYFSKGVCLRADTNGLASQTASTDIKKFLFALLLLILTH